MAESYRIEVECIYSWADYTWVWRVYRGNRQEPEDHGTRYARWTAVWAAKRKVRKLRKGWAPKPPRSNPEVMWY